MANCIGLCDNFLGNGKSSIWDENGELIGELDTKNQGVLLYDTKSKTINQILLT